MAADMFGLSLKTRSRRAARRLALFILGWLAWPLLGAGAELTVFAAASLTDALKELAVDYEKTTGDKIRFNFAASSLLARQIEEGAPADIFFSADEARMNELDKRGHLMAGTRKSRLSNTLVIIVASDRRIELRDISDLTNASIRRVALADPKAVPAGVYARTHLQTLGLWRAIERKVVPTENVRGALAAVESGNVEAAVVYKTDAAISRQVKIVHEVPRERGPEIRYPMAQLKGSAQPAAAQRWGRFLDSARAGQVFERHGFVVRP
jgi:molybdate transport system substrate-binding protein